MIPAKVKRFVVKQFPGKEVTWDKREARGFKNNVYFFKAGGRRFVVKTSLLKDGGLEKRTEAIMLRLLKGGLVPSVVAHSTRRNMLIKSFMSGKTITELSDRDIRAGARELSKLHQLKFKKAGKPLSRRPTKDYREYFDQQIAFLRGGISRLLSHPSTQGVGSRLNTLLRRALSEERERIARFKGTGFTIVNFDLIPKNIMWKDGRPIVIDWGDASFGDPAIEVSRILLNWANDPHRSRQFLRTYVPSDPNMLYRARTYTRFLHVNSLAWEASMYHDIKNGKTMAVGAADARSFEERFIKHYREYMKDFEGRMVSEKMARAALHG